jgi:hypothetical protein
VIYLIVFIFLIYKNIYKCISINQRVVQVQRLPVLHQITVHKNRRRSRTFPESLPGSRGMAVETRSGRGVSRYTVQQQRDGHWESGTIEVLIEVPNEVPISCKFKWVSSEFPSPLDWGPDMEVSTTVGLVSSFFLIPFGYL